MKTKYTSQWVLVLVACTFVLGFPVRDKALSQTPPSPPVTLDAARYGNRDYDAVESSLLFVENVGQFPKGVRFLVYGSNQDQLWLTDNGVWLTQEDAEQRQATAVRLTFSGANAHPRLIPFGARETVFNYYHGDDPTRWVAGAPVWSGVRYVDLYPGVDLVIAGDGKAWTWQLTGASPSALSDLRLLVEGAETVALADHALHLTTTAGDLTLPLLAANSASPQSHPMLIGEKGGSYNVISPFSPRNTQHATRPPSPRPTKTFSSAPSSAGAARTDPTAWP